ncbi:MAG: hypothetical protein EOP43_01655 [Sphingobacteriaceae bacterium]|nr:MAG: hypothetical protein EOP43_01655 [Sphingobacteriaceae bacterium]
MKSIKYIFIILLALYAILSVTFAIHSYPLFRQDAICFLPTSYFVNHHNQLINPLYDAGIDIVNHKFLFYPPLFPYVIALVVKLLPSSLGETHLALTIISICGLIILLLCAYIYIIRYTKKYSYILYAFTGIWIVTLFSFNEIYEGRPEILCDFFIACFLLNNLNRTKSYSNYINGIIIGLNAITSPISTIYLAIITIGILFYFNDFKLKTVLQTIIGFVIIFSSFSIIYPYHLIDLYHGLIKHSTNVVVNRASAGGDRLNWFKSIYLVTPFHPMVGVTFIIAIGYLFYILMKQKKLITTLCFILLLTAVGYFAFKNVMMAYNMYVLAYLYMFLILVFFVEIINKKIFVNYTNTSFIVLFLLLACNSIGFVRTALVFTSTQDKEVSVNNLRKDINMLSKKLKNGKKIYITFSLWPSCLDKTDYVVSNTVLGTPADNPLLQYIILQQSNSGQITAPEIPNYTLIKSNFIPDNPKFLNFKIGNTYPYYQTAIYERN